MSNGVEAKARKTLEDGGMTPDQATELLNLAADAGRKMSEIIVCEGCGVETTQGPFEPDGIYLCDACVENP